MGPSFPQNQWVPFYTFQKSVGSAEHTEPKLTTSLPYMAELEFFAKQRLQNCYYPTLLVPGTSPVDAMTTRVVVIGLSKSTLARIHKYLGNVLCRDNQKLLSVLMMSQNYLIFLFEGKGRSNRQINCLGIPFVHKECMYKKSNQSFFTMQESDGKCIFSRCTKLPLHNYRDIKN